MLMIENKEFKSAYMYISYFYIKCADWAYTKILILYLMTMHRRSEFSSRINKCFSDHHYYLSIVIF